jgi:hypothetical protein
MGASYIELWQSVRKRIFTPEMAQITRQISELPADTGLFAERPPCRPTNYFQFERETENGTARSRPLPKCTNPPRTRDQAGRSKYSAPAAQATKSAVTKLARVTKTKRTAA